MRAHCYNNSTYLSRAGRGAGVGRNELLEGEDVSSWERLDGHEEQKYLMKLQAHCGGRVGLTLSGRRGGSVFAALWL